jgi:hypothetical protein
MMTSPRRSVLSPPVTRCFEFTRFQNQLIALAYQALIPVVSRHLERPRSRFPDDRSTTTILPGRRSQARGA